MITAVTVENFKGISEPVRLELRPITLLFGQNSAGKSSLLHALIYAREVFERHNLDADRTLSAGDSLDLGGFLTFVHDHAATNPVRLRFDLDLREVDLPIRIPELGRSRFGGKLAVDLAGLSKQVERAWVTVVIQWSEPDQRPYVAEYSVGLNGHLAALITSNSSGSEAVIAWAFDPEHPPHRLHWGNSDQNEPPSRLAHPLLRSDPADAESPSVLQGYMDQARSRLPTGSTDLLRIVNQSDALPGFRDLLRLQTTIEEPNLYEQPGFRDQQAAQREAATQTTEEEAVIGLTFYLDTLLVGPGLLLRDVLQQFRYVGPLRQVPPRGYSPPRRPDPARWATGMAGWDLLYSQPALVDRVSRLLADPQRLKLGCTLELVEFREFESRDRLLTALQANTVDDLEDVEGLLRKVPTRGRLLFRPIESPGITLEPADVGVGVSQMIPGLAAALDDQPLGTATLPAQLVAIEHPELNLHPRLQAELADIFLEGALSEATRGRIFFIETHSEILPLRLFRRVRESTRKKAIGAGDGRDDGSGAGHGNGSEDGRGDGSGGGFGDGLEDGSGGGRFDFVVKPLDVGVWYLDRSTGIVTVRRIPVDIEGEFIQPWPEEDTLFEQDFRERYS